MNDERFKATIMLYGNGEFSHIRVKDQNDSDNPIIYELSGSVNVEHLLNSLNEDIVKAENKKLPLHMKILNKIKGWFE